MFLTDIELRELTGYTYNSRQIAWLLRNGWKFEVTGQRRPKVARSYFELRVGGVVEANKVNYPLQPVRPDFMAITKKRRS